MGLDQEHELAILVDVVVNFFQVFLFEVERNDQVLIADAVFDLVDAKKVGVFDFDRTTTADLGDFAGFFEGKKKAQSGSNHVGRRFGGEKNSD